MKNLILGTLCVCLAAVALNAQRIATPPDHFQCYPVLTATPPVPASGQVSLGDQFNSALEAGIVVERPLRFCNPTRKIHRNRAHGVNDATRHLTLYSTFPRNAPLRYVEIWNQFGKQKLRLREPFALAVPTNKNNEGAPTDLDHYRCYVASGREVNQRVGLSDQFVTAVQGHAVLDPVAFCNPVKKLHTDPQENTTETDILHPELHLTCYSMTRTPVSAPFTVIENQFGRQDIEVGPPDTLCVPTKKLGWGVLPDISVPVPGNPKLTTPPAP